MKNGVKAVCCVLLLGVGVIAVAQFLGRKNRADQGTVDLPASWVELKELVAEGRLSEAEAQLRLAEAFAKSKQQERGKGRAKLTPEPVGSHLRIPLYSSAGAITVNL
jgi:hypothetical protein